MQQTKTGLRVQKRIQQFLNNPIEGSLQVNAARGEQMKKKRKATPKQMAALKKARAALKRKYGTSDISKIAGRRGRGGSRRRKAAAATTAAAEEENEMAALEENPRKKASKKRRTKKRATKKRATKKRTTKKRTTKKRSRKAAPKRKATAKKTTRRRTRTQHHTAGKVHIVRLPRAPQVKVIRIEEKKKRRRRRKSTTASRRRMEELALLENPNMGLGGASSGLGGFGALFENPMGPYSAASLKAYGWAAGGVAFGLTLARAVDRYVATRAPADSGSMTGNNPWYGRDAAAAYNRRPDAMRMGAQAAGALAAIGGAYVTRHRDLAPWALGGLALGFGSNLLLQVAEWFIMPRIFKVESPTEATFANRMYPLEQVEVQDTIDSMFETWSGVPSLAEGQQNPPVIQGPLSDGGSTYTLGAAHESESASPLPGAVGGLIPTGRVGECSSCGGRGGCHRGCPSLDCKDCGGGQNRRCAYVVQAGDDLMAMAAAAGVSTTTVDMLNGGSAPTYWVIGNEVILPYEMCMQLIDGGGGGTVVNKQPNGGGGTFIPQQPNGGGGTTVQKQPNGGGGGTVVVQKQPNGGGGQITIEETPPGIPTSVRVVRQPQPTQPSGTGPFARVGPMIPPAQQPATVYGTAGHEDEENVPSAVQGTPEKRSIYVPNTDDNE